MSTSLEKIDIIRERLDVTYQEAKEALEQTDGDVIEAIILLENQREEYWTDRFQKKGEEVFSQIKTYMQKGNDTQIKFKQGDKTLFKVPATIGALGIVGALASTPLAIAAGISTVAAMANNVTLEMDKDKSNDMEFDISDETKYNSNEKGQNTEP